MVRKFVKCGWRMKRMNDLIKRKDVIDVIHNYFKEYIDYNEEQEQDEKSYSRNMLMILSENKKLCTSIKELAIVEAKQVVHGEWITDRGYYNPYTCNVCNHFEKVKTNFCPNCGADMRGGKSWV